MDLAGNVNKYEFTIDNVELEVDLHGIKQGKYTSRNFHTYLTWNKENAKYYSHSQGKGFKFEKHRITQNAKVEFVISDNITKIEIYYFYVNKYFQMEVDFKSTLNDPASFTVFLEKIKLIWS